MQPGPRRLVAASPEVRLPAVVTVGHRRPDLDWALGVLEEAAEEVSLPLASRRAA